MDGLNKMSKENTVLVDLSGSLKGPAKPIGSLSDGLDYPLKDYQKYCIMDIESMTMQSGGFKYGEMMTMTAGRNTGKSMMSQYAAMFNDIFKPQPLTDLKLDEGRVYGARYFTIEPVGGSWRDMEAWCTETFGAHGGAIWGHDPKKPPFPCKRWYMNNSKFWFREVKDRDWFLLRWRS